MKKKAWMVGWVLLLVVEAWAETTNAPPKRTAPSVAARPLKPAFREQERRLRIMNRVLTRLDVSEEAREQLLRLQREYREKMRESYRAIAAARKKLAKLEARDATDEAIDAAIDAVAGAQANQLRVLVHNRREMKRILGAEKYAKFMKIARQKYRSARPRNVPPPLPGQPPLPPRNPPVPGE